MSDAEELEALLAGEDLVPLPQRGDLLQGIIIAVDTDGLVVDLGLKRDGVISRSDLDNLPPEESKFKVGDELSVMVIAPVDRDGNLVVSVAQARESGDWIEARRLMEQDIILEAEPTGYNRGGLIVAFGRIWGFVPASHLSDLPRGMDETSRAGYLERMLGQKMPFKIIEVDPQRRRLVLSERKAIRQWRQQQKAQVIRTLKEGDVRTGIVTSLREFGAFVDIGGADGLIHISELAWTRVDNPANLLKVGQEVEALVIRLDPQANRIGLSLKRLQPSPWEAATGQLDVGQVIEGTVSCLTASGVFVRVGENLEGLLKTPDGPGELLPGVKVSVRVESFNPVRERLDLMLDQEKDETSG